MANNRMILLCNVCQPDDTKWRYHEKGVLVLSKWYPETTYAGVTDLESINTFLEEHDHPEVGSEHYSVGAGQENPVRLVYESKGLPISS